MALPSSELRSGSSFYSEGLAHVRHCRTEPVRPLASGPPDWGNVQPKYLRNACVLHQPGDSLPLKQRPSNSPRLGPLEMHAHAAVPSLAVCDVAVVEALTSVEVETGEGLCKVPPYTWLVLDHGVWTPTGPSDNEFRLAKEAGGGTIAQSGKALLQLVPEERLHARAAEANFRRSARGASVCALRHAALALKLYGLREVQLETHRSQPVPDVDQTLSDEEVAARVQCAEDMVAFRAAAAGQRSICSPRIAEVPPDGSAGVRMSPLQRGFQAWEEFVRFAIRRYGNPVRLWFVMDPEEHMKIGEMQFARACEEMGYRGPVAALWRYLDRDASKHITLQEIDSSSAMLLADLKVLIEEQFDGSIDKLVRALDDNRSNRIKKTEFVTNLRKLGYRGPAKRLFDLVSRQALGFMAIEDLAFLEKWNPPPYLFSKPDERGLQAMKEALLHTHQNLLRAWLKALNPSKSMRVSWEEWCGCCARVARSVSNSPTLPKTEKQMAAVWRALDQDCSGWIALREFDPQSFEALANFKRWLEKNHGGSVARAIRCAAARNSVVDGRQANAGQVSRGAMKGLLRKEGFSKDGVDHLFEGLDVKDTNLLMESDIKFLEKWDLTWEDWAANSFSLTPAT